MKVFDSIMIKNIDELAEWLDENMMFDNAPWLSWWDEHYCNKCENIVRTDSDGYKGEYAYCELHSHCRFFKGIKDIPDNKLIIKMWLESECK